jgi:hypothetical protein
MRDISEQYAKQKQKVSKTEGNNNVFNGNKNNNKNLNRCTVKIFLLNHLK